MEADFLPADIARNLPGMRAGEQVQAEVATDETIDTWNAAR